MEEVAALLKQARETKGVSLEEVETITHVPMRYLEILEGGGDARLLSDRLYLIPFLRNYAIFLDVSPETVVAQFIHELQRIDANATRFERFHEPSHFSPWVVFLSLLVASLAILFFVWHGGGISFLWQGTTEEPPSLSSDLPSSSSTESPSPLPSTSSLSSDLPSSPSPSTPLPSVEAGAQETTLSAPSQEVLYFLRVRAKERTWIRATIDGEQEKDVLLQPGDRVEWSAQKGFILTLGNAGGVELTFNGKDLPSLGVSGQVIRDLRLPPPEREGRG